jgi:hypothetical protein
MFNLSYRSIGNRILSCLLSTKRNHQYIKIDTWVIYIWLGKLRIIYPPGRYLEIIRSGTLPKSTRFSAGSARSPGQNRP